MTISDNYEPKEVWKYFEEICAIPHGSGNTEAIRQYLCNFAANHKLDHVTDGTGNVIIYKPATTGMEQAPALILQGHMDMVAVCTPDSGIDMTTHRLDLQIDGDYLSAKQTSLGGDDGIAVAMILAVLASDSITHPAIEALFTMDEETGMDGARGLDTSLLSGKSLINIDSEEEGYIYAGCAGGARVYLDMDIDREPLTENVAASISDEPVSAAADPVFASNNAHIYRIDIAGLTGGHSGSEIDKGRANANILAGRILYTLIREESGGKDMALDPDACPIRFISLNGGHVDNAIPVSASLMFSSQTPPNSFNGITEAILSEFKATDPDMTISIHKLTGIESDIGTGAATAEATIRLAGLLMSLPNGVQSMSQDIEGLVETSLNLGVVQTFDSHITLQFSVRSSVATAKEALIDKLTALALLVGAATTVNGSYPGWQYRPDSPLRDHMADVYREMYHKEPVIKAIHAGLECGFFASAIEGLDCVSIGPDMYDVHTTKEHLSISSTERTWKYLLEVLKTRI